MDRFLHGSGHGGVLLAEALERTVVANGIVAAGFVVVDAPQERAAGFYEHHGFRRILDTFRPVQKVSDIAEAFRRCSPTGREHATVILTAHAFEMLLKAAIYERRRTVKFSASDRSFDLGKCIKVSETSLSLIDGGDRVVLLALKEDRDTATHDVIAMSDEVLWLHLRSCVTIFRRVLKQVTGQDLTDVMPGRVLPVSAKPPTDVTLVMGKEIEQVAALLQPGRRKTAEARARLLPLIALDRAARGEDEPVTDR